MLALGVYELFFFFSLRFANDTGLRDQFTSYEDLALFFKNKQSSTTNVTTSPGNKQTYTEKRKHNKQRSHNCCKYCWACVLRDEFK